MKKLLILLALAATAGAAHAQQRNTPERQALAVDNRFWEAEFPTGTYIVKLSAICSISKHEYIVDGAAKVTEVSIGTWGSEQARFYYIEPNTPKAPDGIGQSVINAAQEAAQEASQRAPGSDQITQAVVKNYPTTTHAHTVEYRVLSVEVLDKIFTSVRQALLNNQGTTFKP